MHIHNGCSWLTLSHINLCMARPLPAEADPSEIRFPRALALSYGKELEFAPMRRSLDAALALDPEDAETAAMAKWAEGHPRYRRALGLET